MNWKLILALSGFGFAMGIATVYVIPSNVEPLCWLAIFLVCAVVIAKRQRSRPFLHGLCIGLANSVWITSAHVLLFDAYISHHADEAKAMASMNIAPRLMMLMTGPVIGLISGAVLGLLAMVATRLLKPPAS